MDGPATQYDGAGTVDGTEAQTRPEAPHSKYRYPQTTKPRASLCQRYPASYYEDQRTKAKGGANTAINEWANERKLTGRKTTHEDENPNDKRCTPPKKRSRKTEHDKLKTKTARNTRGQYETTRNENGDRKTGTINEEKESGITTRERRRLTKTNEDDDNERSNSYTTENANDSDATHSFPRNDRDTAPRQTSGTPVASCTKTRRALS